jgi:thymidylate kinase
VSFIVIEGDNASGKTTLVEYFQKSGFEIPTITPEAIAREKAAKLLSGIDRINAFIAYNTFCGALSRNFENSLLVRYWISTVAAAYADDLFPLDIAMRKAAELYENQRKPDFIFCLKCPYDARIDRINERKRITGDISDNVSKERDVKYQHILSDIKKSVKNWYDIDTTTNAPEQVFAFIEKKRRREI